jgi:DNA-binding XRE family transcriptional regulator
MGCYQIRIREGKRNIGPDKPKPLGYSLHMKPAQLKAWRKREGYSQSQLAKALDVHTMTISKWEREVREIPPFLYLALERLSSKDKGMKKGKGAKK